jgi:hypothetical protein
MLEETDFLGEAVSPRPLIQGGASAKNVIEHLGSIDRAGGFRRYHFQAEGGCDPAGDLVLQREQIIRVAVEPLRPQMAAGLGGDQLGSYAELVARPTDPPPSST